MNKKLILGAVLGYGLALLLPPQRLLGKAKGSC